MTAFKSASPHARWTVFSLATCLAFVVFAAVSGSASATGGTPSTINICIAKAGPEKGTVRFVSTKRCRKGESFVQVVSASVSQGVLGVQRGAPGEEGPTGDEGPSGEGFLIAGLTSSDASPAITSYMGPFIGLSPTSTELNAQQPMPFAGTIANFGFKIDVPPGAGNSYTMSVRKNGVVGAPAITCKIEGAGSGNTSCLDDTHSLFFAAGDLLSVQIVPRGKPEGWGGARWSATLAP